MIRHRYDYGAILLYDERYVILLNVSIANILRFASKNIRDQLSLWLRPHVAGIPINILMYLIEKTRRILAELHAPSQHSLDTQYVFQSP